MVPRVERERRAEQENSSSLDALGLALLPWAVLSGGQPVLQGGSAGREVPPGHIRPLIWADQWCGQPWRAGAGRWPVA